MRIVHNSVEYIFTDCINRRRVIYNIRNGGVLFTCSGILSQQKTVVYYFGTLSENRGFRFVFRRERQCAVSEVGMPNSARASRTDNASRCDVNLDFLTG